MIDSQPPSSARTSWLQPLIWGFCGGVMASVAMLPTMALLRMWLKWPTPTGLIFDRLFPLLTVDFFIAALVGQIFAAGLGGALYAFYLRRRQMGSGANDIRLFDPRGWSLIVPGILAATLLFVLLLWPTLATNYHGAPPLGVRAPDGEGQSDQQISRSNIGWCNRIASGKSQSGEGLMRGGARGRGCHLC